MIGLSWLGVLSMASAPLSATSQPQPLPNRPAQALANCSLNWLKPPNALAMASASAPDGSLAPPGAIVSQNIVWLACPPPLLRTGVRIASGRLSMPAEQLLQRFLLEIGMRLERRVQVLDVRVVVLVVVDPHRLLVDVRLQGVVGVGQGGKGERHDLLLE